jgi:hypothetical protein
MAKCFSCKLSGHEAKECRLQRRFRQVRKRARSPSCRLPGRRAFLLGSDRDRPFVPLSNAVTASAGSASTRRSPSVSPGCGPPRPLSPPAALPRSAEIEAAELELYNTLVTVAGGTRPEVSTTMVSVSTTAPGLTPEKVDLVTNVGPVSVGGPGPAVTLGLSAPLSPGNLGCLKLGRSTTEDSSGGEPASPSRLASQVRAPLKTPILKSPTRYKSSTAITPSTSLPKTSSRPSGSGKP